jgi:predicted amidohydrolase YtcJ
MSADLILKNGLFTTLDRGNPTATAVAIEGGVFTVVGRDHDAMQHAGPNTQIVDLKGRRVLPGLIDNHLHIIRGGLNFNMELRWDGVRSLADAMAMLKRQVAITPPPQWVRVVGGFTEHQFAEKRLPTIDELNAVAPDTPVFILHLYERAILNGAALRAVGYTKDTPEPPAGEIVRDANGNPTGLLLAKPNAAILYATLAKGPKLPFDYQVNSTRHFMRELNRLGLTGAIDAGGGFQNYPEDYAVVEKLAKDNQLTVRLAYNLFTQKPKGEKADFLNWTKTTKYKQGDDYFRHNGAGEMLVFSAADFEDFRQPRPDMPSEMEGELEEVVRILAQNRWPWRLHATYDETISELVLRPRRDDFRSIDRADRGARRRHRHSASHGVPGRIFCRTLRSRRRRGDAADPPHDGGGRENIGGHRCDTRRVLQSMGFAHLARDRQDGRGLTHLSAAQLPRSRNRAADVDRERHLVLE